MVGEIVFCYLNVMLLKWLYIIFSMFEFFFGMICLNFFYFFGYIVFIYFEKLKMGVRKNILEIFN